MQKVTLDELKQLLPAAGESEITEGDDLGDGLSFKEVTSKYSSFFKGASRFEAYSSLKHKVLASKCPPIKLVGEGSSRVAFACIGGKCLKVAKNDAGVAQNSQEAKHTMKHWWKKNFSCFTQTYDKSSDYGLLLSECCAPIESDEELCEALGVSARQVLTAAIWAVTKTKSDDSKKVAKSLQSYCSEWKSGRGSINGVKPNAEIIATAEEAVLFLEQVSSSPNPAQKSFLEIMRFWKKFGIKQLLPGDVVAGENWGWAIRDNVLTPVMLDAGFSEDVAKKFY